MSSTAAQVKSIILKHGGHASKQQIARELNLGLEYVGLICRDLERKGELTFRKGFYLLITPTAPKKAPHRKVQTKKTFPVKKHRPSSRRCQPIHLRVGVEGKLRRQLVVALGKRKKTVRNVFLGMPKMTMRLIDILEKAGYKTIESLAEAPLARFMQETKLELHEAARLINQARKALNKIGE